MHTQPRMSEPTPRPTRLRSRNGSREPLWSDGSACIRAATGIFSAAEMAPHSAASRARRWTAARPQVDAQRTVRGAPESVPATRPGQPETRSPRVHGACRG